MTIEEAEEVTMPFGKHKGERLDDVPLSYINWLRDIDLHGRLAEAVAVYVAQDWFESELAQEA